ncbi:hypothetical protein FA95DRAFT_1600094 [Auriscalpium vulgare]|uniref:Uncharacterized protein n=1 Tax=Auriscalpium vulgare TaxID=40419 RepID=A0ACB8R430_9AGAM|nr:hypothetical protein FA95DRAFT_1600094 [Auriscalpium vulgare]
MALPSEADKLVSTLAAEFITTVVKNLSTTRLYDVATKDQEWMKKEMTRYSGSMQQYQRSELLYDLDELEKDRLKLEVKETGGLVGILTVRKYRKVRKYQKATEQVKERVQIASDFARIVEMRQLLLQQNLNETSGQGLTDQGIAMQAIVENDPNHLYTATFTTHNTEIKEKHDATTGTFTPTYRIRTETVVYGELYRGDRSGASAEAPLYKVPTVRQSRAAKATARVRKGRSVHKSGAAKKAATVHKPNATRIHARPETDATINVADTSDGVSSDAADSDGPSLSTEFGGSTTYSEIGERMDLNGYEVVETLDIAIGADSL